MKSVNEFAKLYGIRLPSKADYKYYLDLLFESRQYSNIKKYYELFESYTVVNEGFKEDKQKVINFLLDHFKNIEIPDKNYDSDFQEQSPLYVDGRRYVSIDIAEANWSIIRDDILKQELPSWSEYLISLGVADIFAYSKPLRQAILGQVINPKLYDKIEKYYTAKYIKILKDRGYGDYIIGKNKDEVILEYHENLDLCDDTKSKSKNITYFSYDQIINYGDTVNMMNVYSEKFGEIKYKKLYAMHGDRFYLHFKTLVVGKELDKRDLIVKKDKFEFIFSGKDYKHYREYDYVSKHLTHINWTEHRITQNRIVYTGNINSFIVDIEIVKYSERYMIYYNSERFRLEESVDDYDIAIIKEKAKSLVVGYLEQFFDGSI